MTTHLHAHVATNSSDCDGRLTADYVIALNQSEIAEHDKANGINDFHDLNFKARVLDHVATFCPVHSQSITITEDGIETEEVTDEGHRYSQVQWCEDPDCDLGERNQRDHAAEAAGY